MKQLSHESRCLVKGSHTTVDEQTEERLKELILECRLLTAGPSETGDEDALLEDHGIDSPQELEIAGGLRGEDGDSVEEDGFDTELSQGVKSIADFARGEMGIVTRNT